MVVYLRLSRHHFVSLDVWLSWFRKCSCQLNLRYNYCLIWWQFSSSCDVGITPFTWRASFIEGNGDICNYCCPLNMIDLPEPIVFPTSSDELCLSKLSHAYAWGLFFGINLIWWAFYHGSQCLLPVFLGMLKEFLYVDIVHQHDTHYCSKAREAPWAADAFLQQGYEQIGNESHPHLYLDGIGALAVEVSEREVLLYLPVIFMRSFT